MPDGSQHFWAEQEQNVLVPVRHMFQNHRFMASVTAHDTCYNARFEGVDQTTKNEHKEKQGKTGLWVSKAIENLRLDLIKRKSKFKINCKKI